jgi:hypothetical protein
MPWLSYQSNADNSVPAVQFWQSCLGPVLPILSCLSHSGCSALAFLHWLSCSSRLVLAVLFWLFIYFLFCPGCLILAVLGWQPYYCSPGLAALSWLSYPGSRVIAVLFCLSFLPVLCSTPSPSSPFCPALAVLSWQPYCASFVLPVQFYCPVLPVLF